ncbi:hypothetical protein [Nostoc sp.]|uniref:hypothetical protein n=1 Tax=Nostoc sp. TaxID=1180 RepID=UPI002FF452EA
MFSESDIRGIVDRNYLINDEDNKIRMIIDFKDDKTPEEEMLKKQIIDIESKRLE